MASLGNGTRHESSDFGLSVPVESVLVRLGSRPAERIKETKRGLSTDFVFVAHAQGTAGGSVLGGSKGSRRSDQRGKDGGLHGNV